MATTNAPSYASPQTSGKVRRSELLSDAIRQMQSGRTAENYRTDTAAIANTLSDAVLGYARNNADTQADAAIAADKTRLSDLIRGQFPDQAGVAQQQLTEDRAFDLTPQGSQQRQDQGKIGGLADLIFQSTGDPAAAINAGMGQQRQAIEDRRYGDEQKYARSRDARGDYVQDRAYDTSVDQFDRGFGESARQFDATLGQNADQFGKTHGLSAAQLAEQRRHNIATEGMSAAELAAKAAASNMPKPEDVGALRKEWNSQAGDFRGVRDAYSRVQASAEGKTPAQQMSLIFAYMKMLDPTSAVRETEYANAENARGVPDGIRNLYNKVLEGQFLTQGQIQDFSKQAGALYENAEKDYARSYDFYRTQAQNAGMAPDVIQDFRVPEAAPVQTGPQPPTFTAPNGKAFKREEAEAVINFMSQLPPHLQDQQFISQLEAALGGSEPAEPTTDDLVNKWLK